MDVSVKERPAGRDEPVRERWWRRVSAAAWPNLAGLLIYCVLAVLVFAKNLAAPTSRSLGPGTGDEALFIWFLRWMPHALEHGLNPLWTDHINVPDGVNLMWNTSLLLPGLLLAPVTRAFGPLMTFNLLLALGPALSAWCAAFAFRRYVRSRGAALLGGLVYGFSPYMLAQSRGHLQLTLAFLPPLMLLALDEILVGQRRPPLLSGAALGFLTACQLLIGEEVLALTAIVCAAQLLLLVMLFPRHVPSRFRHALLALAATVVVFAVLAAWPLYFQLFGPQRVMGDLHAHDRLATDLYGLVVPNRVQAIAPDAAIRVSSRFTTNIAETNGYLGIPLILILVFTAVRWWRTRVVRAAALLMLVPLVLSMGARLHVGGHVTGVPLPWATLQSLPLLESAAPNRFMLLATLLAGLLLAFFADRVQDWPSARKLVALALIGAALLALMPRPVGGRPVELPAFFAGRNVDRIPEGSVALLAPFPSPRNARPMFWQAMADLRFRMPGGYFVGPDPTGKPKYGSNPRTLSAVMAKIRSGRRAPKLGPGLRAELVGDLAYWRVGTIVVGPMERQATQTTMVEFFTDLLGRRPARVGDVFVWWDLRLEKLRVPRLAEGRP